MLSRTLPLLLPFTLLAACEISTITAPGPGDEPAPGGADAGEVDDVVPEAPDAAPPEDYALLLEPETAELRLNEVTEFQVTITSDRFEGAVVLSAAGAPESWTVEFDPSNILSVPADGIATATVRVRVPSDAEAVAPAMVAINATGAPGQRTATAAVSVINELIVPFYAGTGQGAHVLPPAMRVRLGASVTFLNQDSQLHRIHSTVDDDGFPHQPEPGIAPGQGYTITPTAARNDFDYYCHEHGAGTGTALIQVVEPTL